MPDVRAVIGALSGVVAAALLIHADRESRRALSDAGRAGADRMRAQVQAWELLHGPTDG